MGDFSGFTLASTISCLLLSGVVSANPFSFEANVGRKYDDNVSVDELDSSTGLGDHANLYKAAAGFNYQLGESGKLSGRYSYSGTAYDTFDQFDIDTTLATLGYAHDFGGYKAGFSFRRADSELGGDDFLALDQFSVYFSTFLKKKLFFKTSYTLSDKDFDSRDDRDADKSALAADLYYFANGVKNYYLVGYKYTDEDANVAFYGYQSHKVKARYVVNFSLFERRLKWKIGLSHEQRDYADINPSIGEERSDDRTALQTSLEIPIGKDFFAMLELERANYDSNLESADYSQNEISFRLGYKY